MATQQDCDAAGNAVGWDVPAETVDEHIAEWRDWTVDQLKDMLNDDLEEFERRQFRDSIELADRIDSLRITISVREVREVHG